MKSKFLTEESLSFNRKEQSFSFAEDVVDEIAEKLVKEIEKENYRLWNTRYGYSDEEWGLEHKTKILQSQIAMFLPTLNGILEEYFSIRNISIGTSLNTLNFMFCFTSDYHYTFPFAINFIKLLDNNNERFDCEETKAENRIIKEDLRQFQRVYDTFNLETITKSRFNSPLFWSKLLRLYITDVIHAVKNHDVFKVLGNITDTEVTLGQNNNTKLVEDFFTYYSTFPKKHRLPGNFSDSYMAVSNRNHLLSPDNPEHVAEINRIIEKYGISQETLNKFHFHHETTSRPSTTSFSDDDKEKCDTSEEKTSTPSIMSLSDDDMDSTIDPEDQEEISAESTKWRDALTPSHSSNRVTRASSVGQGR